MRPAELARRFSGRLSQLSATELAALVLVVAALALRLVEFWRLPGINGDEAWYGVQALNLDSGAHVDWRTPTGNLLGPAQLVPLWLLHLVFEPSTWLLRAPALFAGALQVAVVWYVAARAFGRGAGAVAAAVCACLPVNMAYARFGWDPSHLGLWGALAAGAALKRRVGWLAVVFALGLWIHPTHVFIAPFLGLTFAGATLQRSERAHWKAIWTFAALLALAAVTAVLEFTTSRSHGVPAAAAVTTRLTIEAEWTTHAAKLANFFLGDATYEYITGVGLPGPEWVPIIAFWALVLAVMGFGLFRLARARSWLGLGTVAGAVASQIVFFAIAGPRNLAPGVERFGLALVTPSVLALVACASAPRAGAIPARALWRHVTLLAMSALLLAGFGRFYLIELHRTGSTSHRTFWTGPIEPKVLAVRRVLQQRRPGAQAVILADDWWTSWLARYLTYRQPDVRVTSTVSSVSFGDPKEDVFVLGFPRGVAERWVVQAGGAADFTRQDIRGYSRSAVVSLWHPR